MPLSIIFILLIIALVNKNKTVKQSLIGCVLIMLYLLSNGYFVVKTLNWWEPKVRSIATMKEQYDVGILLSGGLMSGQKPGSDHTSMGHRSDRVLQAFRLYKAGKIKKILITGRSADYLMEVKKGETRQAAALMVQWGVAANDIIFEEEARNTRENARYSARILRQRFPSGKYVLITSAFHMRRSAGCFNKAGVQTDLFPADYLGGYNSITFKNLLVPDPNAFADFSVLWHEIIGFVVYKLAGYC